MNDLEIAQRSFKWFYELSETEKIKFEFKCDFRGEAKNCQDLLNQASYHLTRAKRRDEEERELKRKQEIQFQELKEKQLKAEQEKQQELEMAKLALIEKRAEYVKRTQNYTQQQIDEGKSEKSKSSKKVSYQYFNLFNQSIGYFCF